MLTEVYEKLICALGDVHVSYVANGTRNIANKGSMEGFLVAESEGVIRPYKLNGKKPVALPLPNLTGKPYNPFDDNNEIEFFHPLYEAASDKKTAIKGFIDRLVGIHLNDHVFKVIYLLASLVVDRNVMVSATPEQRNAVSKLKNVTNKTVEFLNTVATKDIKSNKRNAFCKLMSERHVGKTSNYKAEAILVFPLYTEVMDERIPNPLKTAITKEVREGVKQLFQTLLEVDDDIVPTTFNGYSNNAMCPVFLSTIDAVYRMGYRINGLYELLGPLAWKASEIEDKLVDLSFVETMNWIIDNPVDAIKVMKEVPQQASSYPITDTTTPPVIANNNKLTPQPPKRSSPIPVMSNQNVQSVVSQPPPVSVGQNVGMKPVDYGELTRGSSTNHDYNNQTNSQFPGITKDGLGFFYINGRKGSLQEQQYYTDMERRMTQPPLQNYGYPPQGMYPQQGMYPPPNSGYNPNGAYPPPGYQPQHPPQGMYPPPNSGYNPNGGYGKV